MKKTRVKAHEYLAVTVIWLAVWEIISIVINEEVLFVPPHKVLLCLGQMILTVDYWVIIGSTMLRVLGGFVIGYVLTAIFALLAYRINFLRLLLTPLISVIKATPVASFIILFLMFWGKDFVPVVICMFMVTPIVWNNVLMGLFSVDKNLLEMSQVYEFSFSRKLKYIIVPSLLPYNAAAIGSGLGLCWKAGIAAEVICRTLPSIGNSIWETKFYINTEEMFAWTATVVVLSVIFDKVLSKLTGKKKKEVTPV